MLLEFLVGLLVMSIMNQIEFNLEKAGWIMNQTSFFFKCVITVS